MHVCSQPPFFSLHSSTPHLATGSSCAAGQSIFLSHTLEFGIHIPPPQSNSVLGSQLRSGVSAKWVSINRVILYVFKQNTINQGPYIYWPQFSSSLPSAQSATPEHIKLPGMHVWSLHWNWSVRQVTFWQLGGRSSSPSGQSMPPSHNQLWWMHVMRSLHRYSVDTHNEAGFMVELHPWGDFNKKRKLTTVSISFGFFTRNTCI